MATLAEREAAYDKLHPVPTQKRDVVDVYTDFGSLDRARQVGVCKSCQGEVWRHGTGTLDVTWCKGTCGKSSGNKNGVAPAFTRLPKK